MVYHNNTVYGEMNVVFPVTCRFSLFEALIKLVKCNFSGLHLN